jgi:hypothetical protein
MKHGLVLVGAVVALALAGCGSTTTDDSARHDSVPSSGCDSNYSGTCVPVASYDLDCADISGSVDVVGSDPHGFDADGDGYGCESNG